MYSPKSAVVSGIRTTLSQYLQNHWRGSWPVLWQNVPVDPTRIKEGYLRFVVVMARLVPLGLAGNIQFVTGVLRITLGVRGGMGMTNIDAVTDKVIFLFGGKQIGNIRLNSIRFVQGEEENGFHLHRLQIGFSMIHPSPNFALTAQGQSADERENHDRL